MGAHTVIVILGWILGAFALLALGYWVLALWFLRVGSRATPRLAQGLQSPPPPQGWPKVSVVIPAHNEEHFIVNVLDSIRASNYPNLEIIVAADRCTDRTVEAVRGQGSGPRGQAEGNEASRDRGVEASGTSVPSLDASMPASPNREPRLIEIDHCPADWSGKCHASWLGAQQATGDFLLFADADTTFHPDLIGAAVVLMLDRRLDFLTLLGALTTDRDFERTAQPVAAIALMKMFPLHKANRNPEEPGSGVRGSGVRGPGSVAQASRLCTGQRPVPPKGPAASSSRRRPFANGQFMLFRRETYEALGTHQRVRRALLEDLAFAQCLDKHGCRMAVALSGDLFRVRMYESREEFRRGWKRIFTEAANRNVPRLRANAWRLRLVGSMPLIFSAAMLFGLAVWPWDRPLGLTVAALCAAALTMQAIVLGCAYRLQGLPFTALRYYPAGCLEVASVFTEAIADLKSNRGIEWASMRYRVEAKVER